MRAPLRVAGSSRCTYLSLTAAGEAPKLLVEPPALDLGAALLGETVSAALVLRNASTFPIRVSQNRCAHPTFYAACDICAIARRGMPATRALNPSYL